MRCLGLLMIVLSGMTASADDPSPEPRGFVDRIFTDDTGKHRYVVFHPQGEPPANGWPVVLFLHGAGERGTDGRRQLDFGLGPIVKRRAETFPAIVVFPQAEGIDGPILRTWSPNSPDGRRALAILDAVASQFPTDAAHRILTGWSMGGYGTWQLAAADPTKWTAVLPISGGGDPSTAVRLTDVNIWAFHGSQDRIVPSSEGRSMAQAVLQAGGHVAYSEIADAGHDVWQRVYNSDAVLDWILSPHGDRAQLEVTAFPADQTQENSEMITPPFVPAMVIENALALRIGSDAMQTIAEGLPALVADRGGLSGDLPDVTDQLEMDGRTFKVTFGSLTFAAEVEQTILRPRGADRLETHIAVRNVTLRVGHVEVTDGEVGFQTGPVEIVIGHRAPVWLRVEVRPTVIDRQLSLKLLRSSFEIPDANWFVRKPASITLQGEWLNEREVTTAVVGGVYVRKKTIEEQVLNAMPALLDQLAAQANYDPLAQMVQALWPLPVYKPELRIHPESVSTDVDGVSLTLGATVAAVDSTSTAPVRTVRASAPPAHDILRTTDLRANVAIDVLDQMSSLLAGTSAVQIYASDIPGRPFHELTEFSSLADVIPELHRSPPDSEVWAALQLDAPLHVSPNERATATDTQDTRLTIEAPRLTLKLSVLPPQSASAASEAGVAVSKPVLVFDGAVHLQQPLSLTTGQTTTGQPGLSIGWGAETSVDVSPLPVDESGSTVGDSSLTIDEAGLAILFEQGWRRWTSTQTQSIINVPTLAVGESMLAFQEMEWAGRCLSAKFLPAATKILNVTDRSITIHVRGPHTRWSQPLMLASGEGRTFRTGAVLYLQPERDWVFQDVQLPAGTVWEWRSVSESRRPEWVQVDFATSAAGDTAGINDADLTTDDQ